MKENSIYGTVAVGVLGIIGVSLIIKMLRDKKQDSSGDRAVTDENVVIAMELNSAMHPGRNFVSNMLLSSSKEEIFRIGNRIKDFDDISTEYRNLYKESLSLELQDALGDDYPDFINKLKKVAAGTDMLSQFEAEEIADSLFDEMDGLNWFGRNEEPFLTLLKLSDANFKMVMSVFNVRHPDETFKKMFDNEYSAAVISAIDLGTVISKSLSWEKLVEKVNQRYNLIY